MAREKTLRELRQEQESVNAGLNDLVMIGGVMTTREKANQAVSDWGKDEVMENDISKLKEEMSALKDEIKQNAAKTVIAEPIAEKSGGNLDINITDDVPLIDAVEMQNITDIYDEQQKIKIVEKIVPAVITDANQIPQQQLAAIPAPINVTVNLPQQQAIAVQEPDNIKKPVVTLYIKKILKKSFKLVLRWVIEPVLILTIALSLLVALILIGLHLAAPEYYNIVIDKLLDLAIIKQFMHTDLYKFIVAIIDVIKGFFR